MRYIYGIVNRSGGEVCMNRIKELRDERGLTQEEVAKCLNVKQNTISGYETELREPDQETLLRLTDLFGVSIDYLLGRVNERNITVDKVFKPDPKFFDWLNDRTEDIKEDYRNANKNDKAYMRKKYGFPDIEEQFINKAIEKIKTSTSEKAAIVDKLYSEDIDWNKLKIGIEGGFFKKQPEPHR
jgi:transcriptional regulator with XRE-family HTH domain